MTTRSDAARRAATTSPWPLLVAVGLAVAELGVFTGYVPVAVAGTVLFGGSAAGLAHEAGYGSSIAATTFVAGGVFLVLGAVVWAFGASTLSPSSLAAAPGVDAVARRGLAVFVAGGALAGLGIVGATMSFGQR